MQHFRIFESKTLEVGSKNYYQWSVKLSKKGRKNCIPITASHKLISVWNSQCIFRFFCKL